MSFILFYCNLQNRLFFILFREILKLLKSGVQNPEHVLHPFVLFLALAMTSHKKFRHPVGDILKSVVVKQVEFDLRRRENAWFRRTFPKIDTQLLITNLIRQGARFGGWELMAQGVLDLARGLLDVVAPGFGKTGELYFFEFISCIFISYIFSRISKSARGTESGHKSHAGSG